MNLIEKIKNGFYSFKKETVKEFEAILDNNAHGYSINIRNIKKLKDGSFSISIKFEKINEKNNFEISKKENNL